MTASPVRRALAPLRGLGSSGTGVLLAGLCTFGFLTLAARVLGPEDFGVVSTLWALVFVAGPGLFLPVQQELSRVIGAQRGHDGAPDGGALAVALGWRWSGALVTVGALVGLVLHLTVGDRLFPGNDLLVLCLVVATAGSAVSFTARGIAAGRGDFGRYGWLVSSEAALRLLAGAVLLLVLVEPLTFGIAIALAPFLSVAVVAGLRRSAPLAPGRHVTARELRGALLWLTAGSLLAQLAANAPPLAVQLLGDDAAAETGRFMSALLVARLPIFFFQAVQATLIPNFSALAAAARHDDLRHAVRVLTALCGALVVLLTLGALVAGPEAVGLLFGDGFDVSGRTMAVLAAASGLYLLAAGLSNAAIALHRHHLTAAAWLAACLVFAAVVAVVPGLLLRVELGYLAGTAAASAVLLLGLRSVSPAGAARPVRSGTPPSGEC
jgi:O-antigen/teichoic acid export membrane protein